ncbi:MAG: hypothetical protein ACPG77_13160, partial [Nannocystaceae bacterium]
MLGIWISLPIEERADANNYFKRANAFGMRPPDPQGRDLPPDDHPNRNRYFVPLYGRDYAGIEQKVKLVTGHANNIRKPTFILPPPPLTHTDDSTWPSLYAWLFERYKEPSRGTTILHMFYESVKAIAKVDTRVAQMTASQRALLIYKYWADGDQGIRAKHHVNNKNPKPTYWLQVEDSRATRQQLKMSKYEWVPDFGPGLLVRFSGVPNEESATELLHYVHGLTAKQTNKSEAPASQTGQPTRAELKKLSVPELLEAYAAIVGRPTKSTNRDYLIWKIWQVVKGRKSASQSAGAKRQSAEANQRFARRSMNLHARLNALERRL